MLSTDPAAGADAKAGEVVIIHVGQLTADAGRHGHDHDDPTP